MYESIRSKPPSSRVRATSNSGTKIADSPDVVCANAIGRSFERNQKPVKYWMYD